MKLLKNPNELSDNAKFAGLIYGQPGVGKSTLALSAPNPVLIDADRGMHRVEKRFQAPSLQMDSYKDLLALLEGNELDPFETIVIDTLGKLVDRIGDYLALENPKNRKSDGALTMQGYGALKVEFARLVRLVKQKNKFLLFAAHEREEKDGDLKIVRPDVSGSSGKDLVKDLDFMGYMEMKGNKRTISFTPTEKFYAKNSLNLPSVIEIPAPQSAAENNFIQKYIIEETGKRMLRDKEQNAEYDKLIASVIPIIEKVKDAKTADEAVATINMAPVIWDSQRVMKVKLGAKAKELGLVWDREAKAFKKGEAPVSEQSAAEAAEKLKKSTEKAAKAKKEKAEKEEADDEDQAA